MRSIFTLGIEDLEEILASNKLPDDVTLEGIETRKDFDKLFKHRATPKYIAQAILKDKVGCKTPLEDVETRALRLDIKRRELAIKEKRVEGISNQQENIYKRLQAIEQGQALIIRGIANINELLTVLSNDR